MAVSTFNFTTGPAGLPDIGVLSYAGCTFSPLFDTSLSGNLVKDNAGRTVKFTELTLSADGYITMPLGSSDINSTVAQMRRLLQTHGGRLVYKGRGYDIDTGVSGDGGARDVAWGPEVKLIEFQPLGGGLSAKVRWQCVVRIYEASRPGTAGMLQFNYDTGVGYGEDGYSTITASGTVEIPLKRFNPATRTVSVTADDFRRQVEQSVMRGIDLGRFRIIDRNFPLSRDKRTMEWSFKAEEKPYMDLPPDCTIARGSFSVRPAKSGMGLCLWLCTLRATYTVRADRARRTAWLAFLALLRLRMNQSSFGVGAPAAPPASGSSGGNPLAIPGLPDWLNGAIGVANPATATTTMFNWFSSATATPAAPTKRALLIDFNFDEGIYLDSKTVTFSATWRLITLMERILLASGLWKKLPERGAAGNNLWAGSVAPIMGAKSWLTNRVDPTLDIIVDFGL